jgi:hypothetical protein
MPRDAPVTIAIFPLKSSMRLQPPEVLGRCKIYDACVLVDLIDETAEPHSRGHLNIRADALRRKPRHRAPAHRAGGIAEANGQTPAHASAVRPLGPKDKGDHAVTARWAGHATDVADWRIVGKGLKSRNP